MSKMEKLKYPSNAVVYLGKMDWTSAIDLSLRLGLKLIDYNTMKRFRLRDEFSIFSSSLTSTTYAFDTSKFTYPLSDAEKIEEVQLPENAKNTRAKAVERKAYAIGKDVPNLQPHECYMFDYWMQRLLIDKYKRNEDRGQGQNS